MSLEGDLKTIGLPKVLVSIAALDGNGILTIQGEDDIVAVSFLQGRIVTADALNQTVEDGLGRVLQRQGLITPENFEAAVQDHQGGATGSLGEMLVGRQLISRSELLEALRIQTFRQMLQLLTWKQGEFKFYAGDEVSFEEGFSPISVEELLVKAIDKLGEKAGMAGPVPDVDVVYRQVPPRGKVQVLGRDGDGGAGIWINGDQASFLSKLDGQRRATEVAQEVGLDRFATDYALYTLHQFDLIEGNTRLGTKAASPSAAAPRPAQSPLAPVPAPSPAPPQTADPSLDDSLLGSISLVSESSSPLDLDLPDPGSEPQVGAAEIFRPPDPGGLGLDDSSVDVAPKASGASWILRVIGPSLAALLVLGLGLSVVQRPSSVLLPFPWQEVPRGTLERQVRQSLFQRLDRGAKTFFLMEAHYPDSLIEVRDAGLVSDVDLEDPARHEFDYSTDGVSYSILLRRRGQQVEGLGTTEAITGDFLVDPQFLSSAATAQPPLVLLD
ncbi:MAG: DUF4388 domain-containing protein [Acidobacteriota bacterium]